MATTPYARAVRLQLVAHCCVGAGIAIAFGLRATYAPYSKRAEKAQRPREMVQHTAHVPWRTRLGVYCAQFGGVE